MDRLLCTEVPENIDVFRSKSWEPFTLYKKMTDRGKSEALPVGLLTLDKKSVREKTSHWIRSNVFVPDARVGWVPGAVRVGMKLIQQQKVDLIFTSSPPHSSQLIGYFLKKKTGLPWVVDLRDPWTDIRYYEFLNRSIPTRRADAWMEGKVLKTADRIITVSDALSNAFKEKLRGYDRDKVHVIMNGYDDADYEAIGKKKSACYTILHAGNCLMHQNPEVLWKSLSQMIREDREFEKELEIHFIGKVHPAILETVDHYDLGKHLRAKGFIPHMEIVREIMNASTLLMVVPDIKRNEGIVTGKLFEYIGSGNPVLVIGPPSGNAGIIISKFANSTICDYNDVDKCTAYIRKTYIEWKNGQLSESSVSLRKPYSRRIQTKQLVELFNSVT
ncbi:glycosyltransferase [bacterium]|nr:glycosyltransferase [candidate division CSSED10-310 bacterium]